MVNMMHVGMPMMHWIMSIGHRVFSRSDEVEKIHTAPTTPSALEPGWMLADYDVLCRAKPAIGMALRLLTDQTLLPSGLVSDRSQRLKTGQ